MCNYLAQVAIKKAEEDRDYSEIDRPLRHPFDGQPQMQAYAAPAPDWAANTHVSRSS